MNRILTAALLVLTLSAPALAGPVPEGVTLRAYQPVGSGDPNAISCWARRVTPPIRGLQCARNSQWARLNVWYSSGAWLNSGPQTPASNAMGFSAASNAGQHTPLP
jgi:hypothetical protein